MQHQGVLLNVDCYQELHRLTGRIAGSLAFSLVFLAVGIFFPLPLLERVCTSRSAESSPCERWSWLPAV